MRLKALLIVGTFISMMLAALTSHGQAKTEIRWGSGSLGSSAQVLVSAIATVANRQLKDIKLSDQITAGTEENLALLEGGTIGIAQSTTRESWGAIQGKLVRSKIPDLQMLFTLYSVPSTFAVRADSKIQSIEDLVGKRVSIGPPGVGIAHALIALLQDGYGIHDKVNILRLGYTEGVDQLRNGFIDAAVVYLAGGQPAPFLNQLDNATRVRYLEVNEAAWKRVGQKHPYFDLDMMVFPAKLLKNLQKEIKVAGFYSVEYTTSKMSEKAAYDIVKTIYEKQPEILRYTAIASVLTKDSALSGATESIPVHPGAAKYFKEAGVWKDRFRIGKAAP